MNILGINAYHGDAAAVLLQDGKLVAAVEEERFNRVKHCAGFPRAAVHYCLQAGGVKPQELDFVAIGRRPGAHMHRKILYAVTKGPGLGLLRSRLANAAKIGNMRRLVVEALAIDPAELQAKLVHVEHHSAHIASSFFASGFDEAVVLSIDGFGDFVSMMWGRGANNKITIEGWVEFPHSLGLLYTAVTQHLGFMKYGDEYKVMGLASYGEPAYMDRFNRLIRLTDKMQYRLDLSFFRHHREGVNMTWESGPPLLDKVYSSKLLDLLGSEREPGSAIEKRHENIASTLQVTLEKLVLQILNDLYQRTGCRRLCMAGGVALNCVLNGRITESTPFEEVYVQPAAYDAGTALGAALYVHHHVLEKPREFTMTHAYWGPGYSNEQIRADLDRLNLEGEYLEDAPLLERSAAAIAEGKIVGLFRGRMEFGPRALGNRSILVDPRRPEMKDILNQRIKHREPFRPFAPSILEERTGEYFEQSNPSPFMLFTYRVRGEKRALIPAPTHVDGTGRLQTVSRQANPFYWELIKQFERRTGVPVVLNTSFNENEPIVCTPEEAIQCFWKTRMDVLVLGNYLMEKREDAS